MSQKRKKRELIFTVSVTVHTDFVQELVESYMEASVKAISVWAETKGKATRVDYKKQIKI